jgi:hypothetical protein
MHPEMQKVRGFWIMFLFGAWSFGMAFTFLQYDNRLSSAIAATALVCTLCAFGRAAYLDFITDGIEVKLVRRWRKLKLGSDGEFPRDDIERTGRMGWAEVFLRESARTVTVYFDERECQEKRLAEIQTFAMTPVPQGKGDLAGWRTANAAARNEWEERKRLREIDLKRAQATAEQVFSRYNNIWELFQDMKIGDGKSMPRHMLPVNRATNLHWSGPEEFRQMLRKAADSPSGSAYV